MAGPRIAEVAQTLEKCKSKLVSSQRRCGSREERWWFGVCFPIVIGWHDKWLVQASADSERAMLVLLDFEFRSSNVPSARVSANGEAHRRRSIK